MEQLTADLDRLSAADDAELANLLAGREQRTAAVDSLLKGLAEAGPWTGPVGVVRIDVELPSGGGESWVESWTVRFSRAGVGLDDTADPEVVLRMPLAGWVRLVTGQNDGALLHLAGILDVVGDEDLVLKIGADLRAPGSARALIDPAALDPEAVSAAIAGVRTEHLAAVMAGGFRPLVLAEVFGRFPEFLIAEKAARAQVAIAFEIGGLVAGGADRYVVRIDAGECTVITDAEPSEPVDATLFLEGHEFLRLVLGHLNPVRGVLSGQIRVQGQVLKALGFNAVMRIPGT